MVQISGALNNPDGTFTNNGVLKYGSRTGNAIVNSTNPSVIVNNSPTPIFTYGGTYNGTVNGIYSNTAATTSAGTFTAPNTFTPSGLSVGLHTLYAKITPQGGSCTYIVPFTYYVCSSTYTVTNTNDAGAGSLRQAMLDIAATTCPGPFTITASVSGTINLASVLPDITKDITFIGPGASNLTVRRNSGGNYRIFTIPNTNTVSFDGFTIADGFADQSEGGGIKNFGTLTLSNCILRNNQTNENGGGVQNAIGGRLTVTNCRFEGNSAVLNLNTGGGGGVVHDGSFLSITNSTFISNSATSGGGLFTGSANASVANCLFTGNMALSGGGMESRAATTITITNCTFSNNTAENVGGAVSGVGDKSIINTTISQNKSNGGGITIYNNSTVTFKNCIIAGNTNQAGTAANDINNDGGTISSSSYNVIGTGGSGGLTNGVNNNIVGVTPLLSTLGNYGGPTQTHALLPGSPAINAGTNTGAPATDARGINRVGNTDIGSFESRGFNMVLTSGNNQNTTVSTAFANPLRVAVTANQAIEPVNGGVVTFAGPGLGASINPVSVTASISGAVAPASVTANATSGGPYSVTASANGASPSRIFNLTNTFATPTIANFSASPAVVCSGSPVTFTATIGNVTGNYNYTLTNGSSPLSGTASGNFSLNVTTSGSGTQNFTLLVSNGGQSATAVTSLMVGQSGVTRLYVKANATGANTGLNWQDAFTDLQSALLYPCVGSLREIWIARGVYKPRSGAISDAFSMLPDVAIYGGFEGTEMDLSQRPPITLSNPSSTTLSADIDGDGTVANNSRYIIYNTLRLTNTAILDGAVITPPLSGTGTGAIMNNSNGDPNETSPEAQFGSECSPQFRNLLFTGYTAGNDQSNSSGIFVVNTPRKGGVTNPSFVNCVFRDNTRGGIYNDVRDDASSLSPTQLNPVFTNCVFANSSNVSLLTYNSGNGQLLTRFVNCSFLNLSGGVSSNSARPNAPVSLVFSNCVLWNTGGSSTFRNQAGSSQVVTTQYSLLDQAITGYTSGPGNLTTTSSPYVSANDPTLPNTSPAVNAGDPASVTVASGPYSATNLPATDAASNPRIIGIRVDMGALEVQNPAAPVPTITGLAASPTTVCAGSPITLTATIGNFTGDYGWSLSNGGPPIGSPGPTSTTSLSVVVPAIGSGPQTYTLTVTSNGQSTTATANVTVNSLPTANLTNNGPLSCTLTNVTLTASGGTSYTFANSGGVIGTPGASNTVVVTNSGTYSVSVANASGCVSTTTTTVGTSTATVTVSNPSTTTATLGIPFSQTFTAGGGVTPRSFSLASGTLPTGLSLATTGVLSGTPTQSGIFPIMVRATDANGCSGVSATYSLTVNTAAPVAQPDSYTTLANTILNASSVLGNDAGTALTIVQYQTLSTQGGAVSMNSNGTFTYSPAFNYIGADSFTYTIQDNIGQQAIGIVSLTVNPQTPTIAGFAASSSAVCVGSPFTFTATVGNVTGSYNYTLTNGSSSTIGATSGTNFSQNLVASGNGSQSFTLTVTSNGQSATATTSITVNALPTAGLTNNGPLTCSQTSVTLTASGGTSYTFANPSGQVITGSGNTRVVSTAGTYSVTAANANGCVSTTTTTVSSNTSVPTASILTPTSTTLTCTTTSISLTATGGGTYRWDDSATSAVRSVTAGGTYSVTVTSSGCSSTTSLTIYQDNNAPTVSITPSSATLTCAMSSVSLSAVGIGTYRWNTGAITQSISATSANTYSVTITATNGCTASASVVVGQNTSAPSVSINPSSVTLTCATPSVSLSAIGTGTYRWSTGATTPSISATSATTYSVTLTGSNGCTVTTSVQVFQNTTPPSVSISVNPSLTITPGQNATLTASGASTYLWSTGVSTTAIVVNAPSVYSVTGTVGNCSGQASVTALQTSPPTGTFAITAITNHSCQQIASNRYVISFTPQYSGLNGQPVSFSIAGEIFPTTAPGPYTLQLYTDNPTLILHAQQTGTPGEASYTYNWLDICQNPMPNTPPRVDQLLTNQVARVGQGFGYTLPQTTFTDNESPQSLSITVNGLPAGLTFTPPYQIGGVPTLAGTSSVTVTATDPGGLTVATTFVLTVVDPSAANTPPTLANPVPNQVAVQGQSFSLSLANTFTDAQTPQALTLASSGLPTGLTLTGTSISGTPSLSGTSTVSLTATDSGGLSATATFAINVLPSSVTATGPFAITGVNPLTCTQIANNRYDISFLPQYSGLNGQAISFWVEDEMSPTTATGPYSLQLYNDNPIVILKAQQAGSAGVASFTYNWLSFCRNPQPNTPPRVNQALTDQVAKVGEAFGYTLPQTTFTDNESPHSLSLTVSGLPTGLNFSPPTQIGGIPSVTGVSSVTVTATDPQGLTVSTSFILRVIDSNNCRSASGAITSMKAGNWNDPTVWSCGTVPTQTDRVLLNHAVALPAGYVAQALSLGYGIGGKLTYQANSRLRLGF
ncbi:putative Ig domain-containing protein [Spirosoma profusum]|uniref:putative Ig domain-containing protein n=1 Tax=Spirosoma profusum TaxID=2771354 RepID=UPI0016880FBD|nr:putative Ig domain-containing protein [Spirosoma profusum]